ncbi:protein kinase [Nonomuraea rubra]|uniref:protein kinase domain-containing protein n=1 Tax=Nonomuraea rubra TaxID=46180 RepID=UPI0031E7A1B1
MIEEAEILPLTREDPRQISRYAIQGRLGAGGQGVVYLGRDPGGRPVAVKVLRESGLPAPQARARFAREVDAARSVPQAHTAAILDADVLAERPYIVSEYVPGLSLQAAVERNGVFTGNALERLATHTITALAAIHGAKVVHRDFKPANVLIGPDGPRVVDFGIARALESGAHPTSSMLGTPPYMAPEQLHEQPAGAYTDVFAWAATMVFAATGRPPFGQGPFAAVAHRILNASPNLDGVPAPLRDVLARCLAKDPAERPAAIQVLQSLIGHGTVVEPESWQAPTEPARKRTGLLVGAVSAALVVLTACSVAILRYTSSGDGEPAASRHTGPAASQHTGPAASQHTGPAASERTGAAASENAEPGTKDPADPAGRRNHWPLGEGSGTQAADSAGEAKLLLHAGAGWDTRPPAPGRNALLFDGVKGYAATEGPAAVDPARSFTVAAMARIDRLPAASDFAAVLSQDSTDDVFSYTLQNMRCTAAGKPDRFCPGAGSYWAFSVHETGSVDAERAVAATAAELRTWTRVAGVHDREAGEIRIYVNGRLEGIRTLTNPVRPASGPFYLGARHVRRARGLLAGRGRRRGGLGAGIAGRGDRRAELATRT